MGRMIRTLAGILLLLAAAVLAPAGALARTEVSALRLGLHPDGITRLALDTSSELALHARLLAAPDRVVLSGEGVDWRAPLLVPRPVGVVAGLRWEPEHGGRLVIRLRRPAVVNATFAMSPREGSGWRFVLDLREVSQEEFLAGVSRPARRMARRGAPPPPRPAVAASAPAPAPSPAPAPPATPTAGIVVMSPLAASAPPTGPPTGPSAATPAPPPESPPMVVDSPTRSEVRPPPPPRPEQAMGAAEGGQPAGWSGGPMLSAPMPPPPERPVAAIPAVAPAPPPAQALPVTPVAAPVMAPLPTPRRAHGDGKPVIVIDPGHGGVDPGATGVSGIYEKYITLALARELKAQLERTGRFHVHLTRDRDVFIPLRERVAIARRYGADLFISLHANVVNDPQIRGLSIYTLSQTASDTEAQALADKENKADLISGVDLSHESADVANILIDLAQRETMNRSAAFASDIVAALRHETVLLTNTHRFAGFAVLKGPDVPAVLIETGYLSNEAEERDLRTPAYRARLARAITHAVVRFFQQERKARHP